MKRIPFEDMEKKLKNEIQFSPPVFNLGNSIFESKKHELVVHYQRIKLLEKYGWDLESFVLEIEKRNIVNAINQFNESNGFPEDLVDRAKEFFPNARFTQARIELE
ncbi:MAG TPA: hypothetical protein VIY47_14240 [Ignavibacteriaceae bacterium]